MVSNIYKILTTLLGTTLISCSYANDKVLSKKIAAINASVPEKANVQSKILTDRTHSWKWNEEKLPGNESLICIQFISEVHGWVASYEGSVYETKDKGKTWRRNKIIMPADSYLTNLFFIDDSFGWATLVKDSTDRLNVNDTKSWLVSTNDGGRSWDMNYSGEALQLSQVLFVNANEGWAFGQRSFMEGTLQTNLTILHTEDQGKHWKDISVGLNHLISNPEGVVNDSIGDVIVTKYAELSLVTLLGKVFNSTDKGKSWRQLGNLKTNDLPILRIQKTQQNRLWTLGGANNRHGIRSVIARMDEGSWVENIIQSVYFRDFAFISDNILLACGSLPEGNSSLETEFRSNAAIFHSTDGGRNWAIAYRNKWLPRLNAICVTDAGQIFAVGEGGILVRLEPAPVR